MTPTPGYTTVIGMRRHRQVRLTALTRGAALVSLGALAAACTKSAPPTMNGTTSSSTGTPPTINAPPAPASATPSDASDAGAAPDAAPFLPHHTMNALPQAPRHVNGPAPSSTTKP